MYLTHQADTLASTPRPACLDQPVCPPPELVCALPASCMMPTHRHEQVEPLSPPEGTPVGELITFDGHASQPEPPGTTHHGPWPLGHQDRHATWSSRDICSPKLLGLIGKWGIDWALPLIAACLPRGPAHRQPREQGVRPHRRGPLLDRRPPGHLQGHAVHDQQGPRDRRHEGLHLLRD